MSTQIKPIELHTKFEKYCKCLFHESNSIKNSFINGCQCALFKNEITNKKFQYRQSLHSVDINKLLTLQINNRKYNILFNVINTMEMKKEMLIHSSQCNYDTTTFNQSVFESATATFFNQSVMYKIQINSKENVYMELRLKERYIKKFLTGNVKSKNQYLDYIYLLHGYTKNKHCPCITICNKNIQNKLVLYFYCNHTTTIKTIEINNIKPLAYAKVYKQIDYLQKKRKLNQLKIIYWCLNYESIKTSIQKCPLMIFSLISNYYY